MSFKYAYSVYLFTRGKGLLKTTQDLFKQAEVSFKYAYSVYLFTRGKGLLKTTQDLFKQAEMSFKYGLFHVPV